MKTFGPNLNDSLQDDIQKVADRGGLLPRGKKLKKSTKHSSNNFLNVYRIRTRTQSKSVNDD